MWYYYFCVYTELMVRSAISYFLNFYKNYDMQKAPLGTTARTGEKCPESGVWTVMGTPSTTAPIAKNNTMPPYSGKAVTWKLSSYA